MDPYGVDVGLLQQHHVPLDHRLVVAGQPLRRNDVRPARQNPPPVQPPGRVVCHPQLADAELDLERVRAWPAGPLPRRGQGTKLGPQQVEIRLALVPGPPQAGLRQVDLEAMLPASDRQIDRRLEQNLRIAFEGRATSGQP